MDEFEKIQDLIKLKKYEQPDSACLQQIFSDFKERQRSKLLKQSSLNILKERMKTWLSGIKNYQLFLGGSALVCAASVIWFMLGSPSLPNTKNQSAQPLANDKTTEQKVQAVQNTAKIGPAPKPINSPHLLPGDVLEQNLLNNNLSPEKERIDASPVTQHPDLDIHSDEIKR